jgi:hypothetical protein
MTALNLRIPNFGELAAKSEKEDRIEKLVRLYGLCDTSRKSQEVDWLANATYLRGNQLDALPTDARAMLSRRLPTLVKKSKRVAYVANRMLAMERQAGSFLLDNIGRQVGVPNTPEESDVLSAELATHYLRYYGDQNHERDRREDGMGWARLTGRALEKIEWDPDATGEGPDGRLPGAGEVLVRTLSPLQFHMDPWVTHLKDASFVIEVGIRDIDELKGLFGAEATKNLKPESVRDSTYLLDQMLGAASAYGASSARGLGAVPKREGGLLVKTFHFTPTEKNPNGLVIWLAGKEILHEGPLPEGMMPFVELVWLRVSGQHYPIPFHTSLRSSAHYMNVLRSQMIHLANSQLRGDTIRTGRGKVHQETDEVTGRKDLYVDESVRDFALMQYNLDWAAAAKTEEDMWEDMQQVAGMRGPTVGEHVRGVDTAAGQALLKEPDVAGMAMFKRGFDTAYALVAHKVIQVAQAHYKTPRLVRVTGADQEQEVIAFLGSDLSGVADVTTKAMPMMTEAEKRFAMAEAHAQEEFGPYLGPDGLFSIQVKRSKLSSLQNRGIPDIEHIVDDLAAPMTMEELEQAAGEADMMEFEKKKMADQVEMAQMEALLNPPEGEGEVDPEEAMAAGLLGAATGAEEGQPAQAQQGA